MVLWSMPTASQAAFTFGSFLQTSSAHKSSSGWRDGWTSSSRTTHLVTTASPGASVAFQFGGNETIASKL